MSLWWNIGAVKGFTLGNEYESSHIKGYPDRPDQTYGGQTEMNPITTSLINTTMLIGMNAITEKNWKTFYFRCKLWTLLTNNGMIADFKLGVCCENKDCKDNANGPIRTRAFSTQEVFDHIGLVTNANTLTKAKFYKYLLDRIEETSSKLCDRESILWFGDVEGK